MRRTILTGGLVFTGGELVNTEVLVVDERIAAIGDGLPREGCDVLNLEGNMLSPGFIDVHTHGGDGVDINAADYQQLAKLSRFFASQGVTGFLASILTDTEEATKRAVDAVCEFMDRPLPGAKCLGIHLEGPFLSPQMFAEFIQPYLARIIAAIREGGGYAIKHTDGNIMPILDQLVAANPHALHSLDPMAGVDIRKVKELVGDKVALCGNVHCAAMQTGTEQDVVDSATYCMTWGKPGGGYVFATSNIPFRGLPLERYELALSVWRRMRDY